MSEWYEISTQLPSLPFRSQRITASAGVACNRMLSKICSDLNKPDGQYVLSSNPRAIRCHIATTQHHQQHPITTPQDHNPTQHNTTQHPTSQHSTAGSRKNLYFTTRQNTTQHNNTVHRIVEEKKLCYALTVCVGVRRFLDTLPARKIPGIGTVPFSRFQFSRNTSILEALWTLTLLCCGLCCVGCVLCCQVSEKMLSAIGVETCADMITHANTIAQLFSDLSFRFFMRAAHGISTSVRDE